MFLIALALIFKYFLNTKVSSCKESASVHADLSAFTKESLTSLIALRMSSTLKPRIFELSSSVVLALLIKLRMTFPTLLFGLSDSVLRSANIASGIASFTNCLTPVRFTNWDWTALNTCSSKLPSWILPFAPDKILKVLSKRSLSFKGFRLTIFCRSCLLKPVFEANTSWSSTSVNSFV